MRYVLRAVAIVAVLGFVFNLAVAQKALKELPDGASDDLTKDGSRESHQGPDNPSQGNRSGQPGNHGGPDPYGPESYKEFIDKAERHLNDPQWQLKIDLQDPKQIVVNHANGTSEEYWYVLFRVINDNTRNIKQTNLPGLDESEVDPDNPPSPREITGPGITTDLEGVPVNCHLDFQLDVFTHNIEQDPWDDSFPYDPDDSVLTDEIRTLRRANMKKSYQPVSDHSVLQKIAEREGLYEWMGNYGFINESVMLLHPLSDFQRQIGFAHNLTAPDLSGPRCVSYRVITIEGGERSEAMRYVAVNNSDNTFAGVYGQGDTLPDGARLVDEESDEMWGKLTQRRYMVGDCIDSFGQPLRVNDPGYLNARIAGSQDGKGGSYGVLAEDHPAVGEPVKIPHYRVYREGDRVLFDYDTGMKHADVPNSNYRINGKIVLPSDPRFGDAQEIDSGTAMYGGDVVGRPVKVIDKRGRAIRKYVVTYEAGDRISQAAWDVWKRRLGPGLLSRYSNLDGITDRLLTADDPVIGLPKIKMGSFIGDNDNAAPEEIQRGIDTGRRGPQGEVILDLQQYTTGRRYDPKKIGANDFMRDPDGEFTTNREAPIPPGADLNPGEEYVYAPLGNAGDDAVPVPAFDHHDAWEDYFDELSGSRIPLTDAEGNLVRDEQDQILYLKEYEYEYVYLYEFAPIDQDDAGFKGEYGGDRFELVKETVKFAHTKQTVRKLVNDAWVEEEVEIVLPLQRLITRKETVFNQKIVEGYRAMNENGLVVEITSDQYAMIDAAMNPQPTMTDPDPEAQAVWQSGSGDSIEFSTERSDGAVKVSNITKVQVVEAEPSEEDVVVGVWTSKRGVKEGETAESEQDAIDRIEAAGGTIEERAVLTYVNRFRNDHVSTEGNDFEGTGPEDDEFDETERKDNGIDMSKAYKTWSRWTVPPPMVYLDDDGEWQVLTRLADKIGPANRWDGNDAPRFLTRYISEMWGVAIFRNVTREWDYANVYVKGLRGQVSNAGLELDTTVTTMPSPADGSSGVAKSFFNPRYADEDWTYRVRYERLGDEFENYRDLIRRVRTFWYREADRDLSGG